MKSSKCPACSLVQWADGGTCKRCGTSLEMSARPQPQPYNAQPTPDIRYQPQPHAGFHQPGLKSGLAIASMVLAIVAFPMTFLLIGILLAPVAVILGIVAFRKADKQPAVYGGKGFAIAGIAVGSLVCLFFVPIVAAIAIPNFVAAKKAANEGYAMGALRKIGDAQLLYAATYGDGKCGDMGKLAEKSLIAKELAGGTHNGYKFTSSGASIDLKGCEAAAVPESPSEGNRSFYISSHDRLLRVGQGGRQPSLADPVVGSETF